MDFHTFYHAVHYATIAHFNEVDEWFDKAEELRSYTPKNDGWSINDILEHVIDVAPRKPRQLAARMNRHIFLTKFFANSLFFHEMDMIK